MTATITHELIDIIDIQPAVGEYVGCRHPQTPHEAFGVTVNAWHQYHAQRIAVNRIWNSTCECCGHHLRYCHITRDQDGGYHCFGRTCLDIKALGEKGAMKLAYSERIEEKERGFCATFNVPQKFWDMPREQRPAFARPWKGKSMTRRGMNKGGTVWKLSVWGESFEDCLAKCMELSALLGIKLA